MKTLNFITKATRNMVIVFLVLILMSSYADGDKKKTCKSKNVEAKKAVNNSRTARERKVYTSHLWMIEDEDQALKVKDLGESYSSVPTWRIEAKEPALKVTDSVATEGIIPLWMIVEEEPELSVADLHY